MPETRAERGDSVDIGDEEAQVRHLGPLLGATLSGQGPVAEHHLDRSHPIAQHDPVNDAVGIVLDPIPGLVGRVEAALPSHGVIGQAPKGFLHRWGK